MRSIRAVGFDMDYTLVHYHVREWEERAYEDARARLSGLGVDVEGLSFDSDLVRPGIVLDLEHGNAVKTNRFGFIKQACHGTAILGIEGLREGYSREIVDLNDKRWRVPRHLVRAVRGLPVPAAGRPPRSGAAGRAAQLRRALRAHPRVRRCGAHGGHAQGADRQGSHTLRRRRSRAAAGAARPEERRQEAAADHQLRVVVHARHDAPRARSSAARRHDLPRAVRRGDRRRAQAHLLRGQRAGLSCGGRGARHAHAAGRLRSSRAAPTSAATRA